jgi:hypothetical protein
MIDAKFSLKYRIQPPPLDLTPVILPERAKDNCKENQTLVPQSPGAAGSFGQKMAGLRVGTVGGGPTVRVARPGLGTGAVVSGEEIVSADIRLEQIVCL